MSTTNKTEYRVDEPSALDDLESLIGGQKNKLSRLEQLSDEVDGLYADAPELDTEGRETVAQEMREVQHNFASVSTIKELEATKDHVAEVVAAPCRQAVKRARSTLCETVGIKTKITDETLESLNDALQRRDPDELREMATSFDDLTDRLTTCPTAAQTAVGQAITTDVHGHLLDTDSKLDSLVTTVEGQVNALEAVDDALDGLDWDLETALAETADYYGSDEARVDADRIVEYIDTIDARLAETNTLDLADFAHTHLESGLPVTEATELIDLFKRLSRGVTDCASHEQTFVYAGALVENIENPAAHNAEAVVERLEAITNVGEDDRGDEMVTKLANKLRSLAEAYGEWAAIYARQLTRDVVAINAVEEYLTDLPSFDAVESTSPSVVENGDDETAKAVEANTPDYTWVLNEDPTAERVAERPVSAVVFHQHYEAWVDTLRGSALGEGGADIDHLLALVRGENVSAVDVTPEAFETLEELLGDILVLKLTDSPAEGPKR
ncbi:hypothetical protein ACFQO4_18390 [Saliphagus sp. GCM10025334]